MALDNILGIAQNLPTSKPKFQAPRPQYGGYNQSGKAQPMQQQQPVQGSDMAQLFAALAQSMQAQTALAPQKLQLQNDALFGRKLGIGGERITEQNPRGYAGGDPFTNGFFKDPAQRQQIIDKRSVGMPGVESLASNPTYQSQGFGLEGAVNASPAMFDISGQNAALQQGIMSRVPGMAPRASFVAPPANEFQGPVQPKGPVKPKPFSMNASASPRRTSFGF